MRASSAAPSFSAASRIAADLGVELLQTRFDLSQLQASFFAGLLRFLHRLLNRIRPVAEDSRKKLASSPDDERGDHCKIENDAEPVGLLQIQSRQLRNHLDRGRLLELGHLILAFAGGLTAFMSQLAARTGRMLRLRGLILFRGSASRFLRLHGATIPSRTRTISDRMHGQVNLEMGRMRVISVPPLPVAVRA